MRSVSKTAQEKAEIEAADRSERRKGGFALGKVRDIGSVRLSNGVRVYWHVDAPLEEGQTRRVVPDNYFILEIGGQEALFDAEEFRKYLRWV